MCGAVTNNLQNCMIDIQWSSRSFVIIGTLGSLKKMPGCIGVFRIVDFFSSLFGVFFWFQIVLVFQYKLTVFCHFDCFLRTFQKLRNLLGFFQSLNIAAEVSRTLKQKMFKLRNTLELFKSPVYTHRISYTAPKIQNCPLNLST